MNHPYCFIEDFVNRFCILQRQGASDGEDKRRSNQSRAGATTAGRGGRNGEYRIHIKSI